MHFWLGTHQPAWLERLDVPLCVSRRRLAGRKRLPRARVPWVLDSGGYSELDLYGEWTVGPEQYVAEARRFAAEMGQLEWAAPQDWMCEEWILEKTGLPLREHQWRTLASYLTLTDMAPDIPWIPVLQGAATEDYLRHADAYLAAGVELERLPIVGVGSVCRRQAMDEAEVIIRQLQPLNLHGFGFKMTGLRRCWDVLASADSMAWSFAARRQPPLPGCTHKHCNNCIIYALQWRDEVLRIPIGQQRTLRL
jgi:hypothetical protein